MQTPIPSSATPQCANSSKEYSADVLLAESMASLRCSDDSQLLGEKAARVFLDRVLADLGDQIYHMKDSIEQNELLRNFVNDIEFRSGEEIHVIARLEDAEFSEPEGSDYTDLKLSSVQPIPLSKLLYGRIVLASRCLWEFDRDDLERRPHLVLVKRCGNEVIVELPGSIAIRGVVDKLSQEHLQLDDNMLAAAILEIIRCGDTEATFTPMNFRLCNQSPTETFLYAYKDSLEIRDVPMDESDESMSIILALGDSEDNKVLESFNEIVTKDYALFSLRWIVDGVSFCHDGTVSNHDRLSNGELKCNDQGGHLWVVPVSNTCVNNPMGLAMRLSGAMYTVDRQVVRLSRQNLERCEVTVAIHFSPSGIADARVPIDDFDVDDEHFLEDLMHAFSNGDLDIILDSVSIELSVIEETLTKLGIDPHHHSKYESDDDTNDESEYSCSDESCSDY